jgi:hypothetical protein
MSEYDGLRAMVNYLTDRLTALTRQVMALEATVITAGTPEMVLAYGDMLERLEA